MFERWSSEPSWRNQALLITFIFVVDVLIVLAIIWPTILPTEPPTAIKVGPNVRVTPGATDAAPSSAPSVSVPPTDEPPPSEAPAGVLLRDTFDDAVMGPLAAPEWNASPNVESFTVAAFPTSVDRSARLAASPESRTATACRSLPDLPDRYTLQADVRLSGDAATGMLMGIESASGQAQIDRSGESLLFLDGAGSVAPDVLLELATWYRLSIQVDVGSASYAVAIEDLRRPGSVFREESLTLGDSAREAGRLCFSVMSRSTAGVNIDNVTVAAP